MSGDKALTCTSGKGIENERNSKSKIVQYGTFFSSQFAEKDPAARPKRTKSN
jgi:hypothetical protein